MGRTMTRKRLRSAAAAFQRTGPMSLKHDGREVHAYLIQEAPGAWSIEGDESRTVCPAAEEAAEVACESRGIYDTS